MPAMKQSRMPDKRRYVSSRLPSPIGGAPAAMGHNQGPHDSSWSSFCWQKAHKDAWETPPIEIIRLRCRRAASLGLTYRQYTSALLDRGVHPRAIFFELGGTLVQAGNGKIIADQQDRVQLLPGVLETLARLTARDVFVISNDAQAASFIAQVNRICGGTIADYEVYKDPVEAKSALIGLLAKYKLPAAAALMIGADVASEKSAQAAKLAKFIYASAYFSSG